MPYQNIKHIFMQRLSFTLLFVLFACSCFCQNNPRPSRSRFYNAKESTFNLKAGDVLVYHVKDSADAYDYIVTINKTDNGLSYTYNIPAKEIKSNASVTSASLNEGTAYQTNFKANHNTALWLSTANYRGLATEKQTMMDMGAGVDTFTNTNTSTLKINYKGREKIITTYKIENKSNTDEIQMQVLNELNNPLIVMMNKGWTLTLKEVR